MANTMCRPCGCQKSLSHRSCPRIYYYTVFQKKWPLCYFIISLLWQLRIAWEFPEVHRRCCLLWIWKKCLWFNTGISARIWHAVAHITTFNCEPRLISVTGRSLHCCRSSGEEHAIRAIGVARAGLTIGGHTNVRRGHFLIRGAIIFYGGALFPRKKLTTFFSIYKIPIN